MGEMASGTPVRDDVGELRRRLLRDLRRVVPIDAVFFAAADPETLLFTAAWAEEPLAVSAPLFMENEFGAEDVNRFASLARARMPVATLHRTTRGAWDASKRSREIMAPLGLGDELRIALPAGGASWGFLCLHREGRIPFSLREVGAVRRVAQGAGDAMRRIVARSLASERGPEQSGIAVVIVDGDRVVAWMGLDDDRMESLVGEHLTAGQRAPLPLLALVRRLEEKERLGGSASYEAATVLVCPTSFVEVRAGRLAQMSGTSSPVAITFAPAGPRARSSLRLAASGVTPAQRRVAELVLQGLSTKDIVGELRIGEYTVQDHLKVVFDRFGLGSRRELVFALLR
jgi:DNA-binding CsgD family transcriptional regulator